MTLKYNYVVCGDFVAEMRNLPDASIQHIITDIPYHISSPDKLTSTPNGITTTEDAWGEEIGDIMTDDKHAELIRNLAIESHRVLESGGNFLIFFDRNKPWNLASVSLQLIVKNMLCFVKLNPVPHVMKNGYRSGFELCSWFCKGKKPRVINFLSQEEMINVFYGPVEPHKSGHPTEKPTWMIEPLILRHTNPGDVILDPFCGSGTVLAEGIRLGRKVIGFDISEKWANYSRNRLQLAIEKAECSLL